MISNRSAHIFRSSFRLPEGSGEYTRFSSIDVEKGVTHELLGMLSLFTDEILAAGKQRFYFMERDCLVIVIPLVGPIEIHDGSDIGNSWLKPEELMATPYKKGSSFLIHNPDDKNRVNFLHLRIREKGIPQKRSFANIEKNGLTPILETDTCRLQIGAFNGRREAEFLVSDKRTGVFAFTVHGTFEVENRLLESRDALFLWGREKVEMEALSENAIMLILELPCQSPAQSF